ncbi:hypothetical protein C8R45DRAFT_296936 [Mycena sanguinolenta]|nr:hypothetical protein C8R45DRAFT_296936 [Mycena sanguinolenta]
MLAYEAAGGSLFPPSQLWRRILRVVTLFRPYQHCPQATPCRFHLRLRGRYLLQPPLLRLSSPYPRFATLAACEPSVHRLSATSRTCIDFPCRHLGLSRRTYWFCPSFMAEQRANKFYLFSARTPTGPCAHPRLHSSHAAPSGCAYSSRTLATYGPNSARWQRPSWPTQLNCSIPPHPSLSCRQPSQINLNECDISSRQRLE